VELLIRARDRTSECVGVAVACTKAGDADHHSRLVTHHTSALDDSDTGEGGVHCVSGAIRSLGRMDSFSGYVKKFWIMMCLVIGCRPVA
jgi:hypothetical protein